MQWEKTQPIQQMVQRQLHTHPHENKIGSISFTLYLKQLDVDQRPKFKIRNVETIKGKHK